MNGEITKLTIEEAVKSLVPNGDDYIHVFMNPGGMLVGADWSRKEIMKLLETAERIEIGGTGCVGMKHGLAVFGGGRWYFIESTAGQPLAGLSCGPSEH